MEIKTASIEGIEAEVETPVEAPAVLFLFDFDKVKTVGDLTAILKSAQLGIYSDNPFFNTVLHLLVEEEEQLDLDISSVPNP